MDQGTRTEKEKTAHATTKATRSIQRRQRHQAIWALTRTIQASMSQDGTGKIAQMQGTLKSS